MTTHDISYSLKELADLTHAELIGDPETRIYNIAELEKATEKDLSFFSNDKYLSLLHNTRAGAVCVAASAPREAKKNYLVSPNPSLTFQKILVLFRQQHTQQTGFSGIHPTAVVHETASIAKEVFIGPYCVVDAGVTIGERCWISAGCYLGPGVTLGSDCRLYAHVTVREGCTLGARVTLQPGAVIGSCGFGYITDSAGQHTKLEQAGSVILEDDVEVGANSTIDRARFEATRIGKGTKIDNLVQIGHNVSLGENNIIVSQTGIAGSCKTGKNVVMGGQSALAGHLSVADNTLITARAALTKSIKKAGEKFGGSPNIPLQDHLKQLVHLRNLDKIVKRLDRLEALLADQNQPQN